MRFAVLGAGAIGAYVGAALSRGGADVTLIARGAHLQAMAEHGVRVESPRGDFTARPEVTGDLAAVADADVVFVALKAYSLPAIAPQLGPLLAPGAAAIWAQNGIPWWYFQSLPAAGGPGGSVGLTGLESVDPGGVIAASISPDHNVGCVVFCSTEIVEPGVIRHVEGTRFTLGEPDGSDSQRVRAISAAFAAGGLRAPGRLQAARSDLAQAGRERRVQPDHGPHRGNARPARHASRRCTTCCAPCSPRVPRWPPASVSRSPYHWTGAWRPESRSATTRRLCCRTWKPESGSSSIA